VFFHQDQDEDTENNRVEV